MPRTRVIKPGFFHDADLIEFPFETRCLFPGLWCYADREGRLKDKPKQIKIDIFPADDVNVDDCLDELERGGFITRYEVNARRYIQIHNWNEHQKPHPKETESTIPPRPETASREITRQAAESNGRVVASKPVNCELLTVNCEPSPSSAEVSSASDEDKPFIEMPTANGEPCFVMFSKVKEWEKAYPNLDVRAQLPKVRQWCIDNPGKQKTRRGMNRFINGWLNRHDAEKETLKGEKDSERNVGKQGLADDAYEIDYEAYGVST